MMKVFCGVLLIALLAAIAVTDVLIILSKNKESEDE